MEAFSISTEKSWVPPPRIGRILEAPTADDWQNRGTLTKLKKTRYMCYIVLFFLKFNN